MRRCRGREPDSSLEQRDDGAGHRHFGGRDGPRPAHCRTLRGRRVSRACLRRRSGRRCQEFRSSHPTPAASVVDVSDAKQVDAWFDEIAAKYGRVDVLVNNAGIAGPTAPVEQIEPGRLGPYGRGRPERTVLLHAPRRAAAARRGRRLDRQHRLERRVLRLSAAHAVRGLQVGAARLHQDAGDGTRARGHPRQRDLPGQHQGPAHRRRHRA